MRQIDLARRRLEQAQISTALIDKWGALVKTLTGYGSAVVAYSGGVDSSFLAYNAALALGKHMLAVTIDSTVEAPDTLQLAADFAAQQGFRHMTLPYDPLQDAGFRSNPADRCYLCKTHILRTLSDYAHRNGYHAVLDGQNDDDRHDYRPGARAVAETGTHSPLAQHGLTKAEIRRLAQALDLSIWNKPSSPCLASRIPYGTPITSEALRRIALAEGYLHQQGFQAVRVRYHQDLARIEIDSTQIQMLLELKQEAVDYFKQIGFLYVALDLQGYRQGSLNEALS